MLGIIGGTGFNHFADLTNTQTQTIQTQYGEVTLTIGELNGKNIAFLPRHGAGHKVPPHKINYRANIAALKQIGATEVIGIAAVGSLAENFAPSALALPDDYIDYSFGRAHTFFDGADGHVEHLDCSTPYSQTLREKVLNAGKISNTSILPNGVYGCTQGPRLETPAEIRRLLRDGCTMVGMTGVPEAPLAAEMGLAYACLAVSVNWAAGLGSGDIHAEIEQSLADGMAAVKKVLWCL